MLAPTRLCSRLRRLAGQLRGNTSGNVTLLMALGMPALIGGAGLAIDTAQWYLWKGELQYSVDQAAIAGAWARAYDNQSDNYRTRAVQEFLANEEVVSFAGTPTVALANYGGGANNSVVVRVSASRSLPFSSFLTGRAATVTVTAQASFEAGSTFTSCLLATNGTESGAVTIGGNARVTARCGIAALSTSPDSIVVNGEPNIDPGWVVSAGGIDDWFNDTDAAVHEYIKELVDPFKNLVPPNNATPRTYACTGGSTSYTAIGTQQVLVQDLTYTGTKANKVDTLTRTVTLSDTSTDYLAPAAKNTKTGAQAPSVQTVTGAVSSSTSGSGKGAVTTYTRTDRVTTSTVTIASVEQQTLPYAATMLPGTYADFDTTCDTSMASGVYVIDGGDFEVNAQYRLLGSGVMIVLKNGARIRINGGASVNLSAMTVGQLMDAGVSHADAQKLAGMLVFEDPNSSGNSGNGNNANRINGNALTTLDGKIYLPRSGITINGTAAVTSQCLMIAADTISIEGTADLESFCPPGQTETDVIATTVKAVRLVS
jgi:Flp pilus assembly protein TadG